MAPKSPTPAAPTAVNEPAAPAATEERDPQERRRYLLRIVDVVPSGGERVEAPFHHHSIAGQTFARITTRPDPTGLKDESGEPAMQRLPGAIAWLNDEDLAEIRKRMAMRYVEWRAGARDPRFPGEVMPRIAKWKGIVRIVPEGRKPDRTWEPAANYLRIEPFPDDAAPR